MPTYKIVLFADDSQPTQVQYMKNQRKAIEDAIPALVVEETNQDDPRLKRYSLRSRANRLPAILVLKDDFKVQIRNFKLDNSQVIAWIKGIMGIS
jgi:hypothetical protein